MVSTSEFKMSRLRWGGYWQKIIDIAAYMHFEPPWTFVLLHLSFKLARLIGLVHFWPPFTIGAACLMWSLFVDLPPRTRSLLSPRSNTANRFFLDTRCRPKP